MILILFFFAVPNEQLLQIKQQVHLPDQYLPDAGYTAKINKPVLIKR